MGAYKRRELGTKDSFGLADLIMLTQPSYNRPMAFAPEGTFTVLERERAASAGRKGGRSRSRNKVAAAQRNGKNGGRPSRRTLIERVLNRPLSKKQWPMIRDEVLYQILQRKQQIVTEFFGADWTDIPRRSWRSVPPHVRQTIRHIKACAHIYGRWPK